MNKYIGISKPLNVVRGKNANLDAKYGPYDSINHVTISIPIAVRRVGLTVGIIFLEGTVETVKEYWWKNGIEDVDLELKVDSAASTKTSQLENDADFQSGNQVSANLQAQRSILDAVDGNLQGQINTHESQINTHNSQIQDIITSYIDNKGYFATLTSLQTSYPTPEIGDTAYVADALSSTGYYIYNVVGGIWISSTVEAPPVAVPINDYTLNGGSTKTTKEVDDFVSQSVVTNAFSGDLSLISSKTFISIEVLPTNIFKGIGVLKFLRKGPRPYLAISDMNGTVFAQYYSPDESEVLEGVHNLEVRKISGVDFIVNIKINFDTVFNYENNLIIDFSKLPNGEFTPFIKDEVVSINSKISKLENSYIIRATEHGYLSSNGSIRAGGGYYMYTDFLPSVIGTEISCYDGGTDGDYVGVFFYDENKAPISAMTFETERGQRIVTLSAENTPSGAKFFRANSLVALKEQSYVKMPLEGYYIMQKYASNEIEINRGKALVLEDKVDFILGSQNKWVSGGDTSIIDMGALVSFSTDSNVDKKIYLSFIRSTSTLNLIIQFRDTAGDGSDPLGGGELTHNLNPEVLNERGLKSYNVPSVKIGYPNISVTINWESGYWEGSGGRNRAYKSNRLEIDLKEAPLAPTKNMPQLSAELAMSSKNANYAKEELFAEPVWYSGGDMTMVNNRVIEDLYFSKNADAKHYLRYLRYTNEEGLLIQFRDTPGDGIGDGGGAITHQLYKPSNTPESGIVEYKLDNVYGNALYGDLFIKINWDIFKTLPSQTYLKISDRLEIDQNTAPTRPKMATHEKISNIYEKIETIESVIDLEQSLSGATIVNFGDSIFGNIQGSTSISGNIASITGALVHNVGFGGCRMSKHANGWDSFSMYNIAQAVYDETFDVQQDTLDTVTFLPSYFQAHLDTLKSIDFNTVDYVTIGYGTNDMTANVLISSEDAEDINTVGGALRKSLRLLFTKYPHLKILVCGIAYRFWQSGGVLTEDSDEYLNTNSNSVFEFNDEIEKVSKEFKTPYLDNYSRLGINVYNRLQFFSATDGTHHNENGRKKIASKIVSALKSKF